MTTPILLKVPSTWSLMKWVLKLSYQLTWRIRNSFLKEHLENVVSWMPFALFSLCEWCKEKSNHQWKSLFDFAILLSWWMVFGCVILFIWFDCMNWFIFSDLYVWFTIFGMKTVNGRTKGVKWMDIGRCRIKWLPPGSLTYSFFVSKGVKQIDIGRCRQNDFLWGSLTYSLGRGFVACGYKGSTKRNQPNN